MKTERTFVMLKPDAIQRGLVGEIIKRIEQKGLRISAYKMLVGTEDQAFAHYAKEDDWFTSKGEGVVEKMKEAGMTVAKEPIEYGKDIVRALGKYMSSGPSLAMVVEGHRAVDIVTKMVGGTEPLTSDIGTIRGDFCIDSYGLANLDDRAVRNLVHCSESTDEAEREIKVWLKEDDIMKFKLVGEKLIYDVDLDGILE